MTRNEYLSTLKDRLIKEKATNIDEIITKYENRFDLGYKASMSDDEIIASLGNIDDIILKEVKNDNPSFNNVNVSLELDSFEKLYIKENLDSNAINLEISKEALEYIDFIKNEKEVTLKTKKEKKKISIFNFKKNQETFIGTLLIGKNISIDNLVIDSSTADIEIDNTINANKITFDLVSSDIIFNSLNSNEITINTTSGDLNGNLINANKLKVNTTSGDLKIDSIVINDDINLASTSGDFNIQNMNANTLHFNSTSGDAELNNIDIKDSVIINTISGDIIIRYAKCNNYVLNSISGNITIQASDNLDANVSGKSITGEIIYCGKNKDNIKNMFNKKDNKI